MNRVLINWQFRIIGYFWIIFGLTGCVYYMINGWRDILDGSNIALLLPVGICCLLAFCGRGLSKEKLWGKIGSAGLVSLTTFALLDMLAMSLFRGNFDGHFWVALTAVLLGIYTLVIIIFVRS
jgi:hypothetical protein